MGARGERLRKALVVAEVSLSLTLLVASALLVQAFVRLQTADFGWEKENLLTFRVGQYAVTGACLLQSLERLTL